MPMHLQAQENIMEINKGRIRALEELKVAKKRIAELGARGRAAMYTAAHSKMYCRHAGLAHSCCCCIVLGGAVLGMQDLAALME
jgi:hypothetical protein